MFDARRIRCCPAWGFALIALATTGCAPGLHSLRVRTADGREWTAVPPPHLPVAITQEELQRATVSLAGDVVPVADPLEFARQQFELPVRSGWYFFNPRTKQLTPLDPAAAADSLPADMVELTRSYLQWCHNRQDPGDCLRLLRHGYALDADARLAVAMDIALGSVMDEVVESLKGVVANKDAARAMFVATVAMYAVLWFAPEPVTKGVAALMTAGLVVYLGVDTLFSLRDGWRRLVARADAAATFDELRSAGEQFGKLMGVNAARILVMVAASVMGRGAPAVVKMLPKLPGAGHVLRFVTAEGVAVRAGQAVTIAESGIILTLAPGAVATSTTESNSAAGNPSAQPSASVGGEAKALSAEAQRGIRSLEKRIAEHEQKLAEFKATPTVRPGMEGQPEDVIEAAQQARIRHLEQEIQTFKENIEKLMRGE